MPSILWQTDIPEQTEEQLDQELTAIFDRQREMTETYTAIAELLYIARAKWIGGMCLPWGILTAGQRQQAVDEVRGLVKGEK